MRRIAIIAEGSILNYSPSMLNLIDFLSENNKIYYFSKVERNYKFQHERNIKNIKIVQHSNYFKVLIESTFKIINIKYLFYIIYKMLKKYVYYLNNIYKDYDVIIVFDQTALKYLSQVKLKGPKYLYSLELYLKCDGIDDESIINYDYNQLNGVIIQSELRLNALLEDYKFSKSVKKLIIPLCSRMSFQTDNYQKQFKKEFDEIRLVHLGWYQMGFLTELIWKVKEMSNVKLLLIIQEEQ